MARYLSLACGMACSLSLVGPAWAQRADEAKVERYTGPAVYLDEATEQVPATRVGSTVQKDNYEDGSLWIERGLVRYSDDSFKNDGLYREYYPDGQKFVEGQYSLNEPTGEWTYWHPNGQVARKVAYKQGRPDGVVKDFRPDGALKTTKEYDAGKRVGTWETYAKDGQTKLIEAHYEDGQRSGTWKWYYESGKPRQEAPFVKGQMEGLVVEWTEDGAKRAEVNFREGKREGLAKQWTADGREIQLRYENGKPVVTN